MKLLDSINLILNNFKNIGNDVDIGLNTRVREFALMKGHITIGKDCIISHFTVLDAGENSKILIGNNCTVGAGTKMYCEPNHYEPSTPNKSHKKGDIIIGCNVMIGANVVILPNVIIGDNCAIGAGAVVTKNIEPNSIAVGVPARVIKKIKGDKK